MFSLLKVMVKILELFSGTGSVGKVAVEFGFDVVSVDIDGRAMINISILDWDYKKDFKPGDFDIIWASPPCSTFSMLRRTWIGRKLKVHKGAICTEELLTADMMRDGLPLLRKAEEIIEYFQPKFYCIENPGGSKMKEFLKHRPVYDVDYCAYCDWGYKKWTKVWTNVEGFNPKRCSCVKDPITGQKHSIQLGGKVNGTKLDDRYRVPPKLISELFNTMGYKEMKKLVINEDKNVVIDDIIEKVEEVSI